MNDNSKTHDATDAACENVGNYSLCVVDKLSLINLYRELCEDIQFVSQQVTDDSSYILNRYSIKRDGWLSCMQMSS